MSDSLSRLASAISDRYTIERELGEGGMATVYLADDLKHDRRVALKVLKPELAAVVGAERFLAEIKTTANLQHPNILPLFDSGEADGFLYYVMPFVEGETLRDRLEREKQLPVDEAVRIATDVAEALQSAHEQGVIHRDIKPANILLSRGRPLVADFGIALAVSAAGAGRLTETGLSLGTPYYMSPEQAAADRDPSAESDVYSLACVLFEMLVGEPPYTGGSAQAVLVKILTGDAPAPTEARASIPANVDAAIKKALERLPADRFRSAAEFARALGDTAFLGSPDRPLPAGAGSARWLQAVPWALAATAIGLALWTSMGGPETGSREIRQWNLTLPDSIPLVFLGDAPAGVGRSSLVLSPDSRQLVYLGLYRGDTKLFLRDLQTGKTRELPGTEGAFGPFFSPDGGSVAFFVETQLKRVSISGGPAIPVADIEGMYPITGVWKRDGRIVASADGCVLFSVSDGGGQESQVSVSGACPWDLTDLPDDDLVMGSHQYGLTVSSVSGDREWGVSRTGTDPIQEGWVDPLVADDPHVLQNGHITFVTRDGTLTAMRFDADSRTVEGVPVPLIDGVRREGHWGSAQYTVGGDGTLVYAPGENALYGQLVWVDREGNLEPLPVEPGAFGPFKLSPDGSQMLLIRERNTGPQELWMLDLERGDQTRLFTANDQAVWMGAWANTAPWYVVSADRLGQSENTSVRFWTDGSRQPDTLATLGVASSVSPDDRWVTVDGWPEGNIWVFPTDSSNGEPVQLTDDPGGETFSDFSPDGRWIAYTSDRDGRMEVYVESFPPNGQVYSVSPDGGEEPAWSPKGGELFYRNGQQFMSARYSEEGGVLRFQAPTVFTEGPYVNLPGISFTVSTDGERLLLVRGTDEQTTTQLNVITNWADEVKRRVDAGNR